MFTGANPAAERLLGLTLDQIQGRSVVDPRWQAISEDGFPMSDENHPSLLALRTGQPSKNVVIGIHNLTLGERRWLRVNSIPQFLPGETRPFQVYSILDDITARKTAEGALLASNRRITDILESITDAFFALDQYWRFTYVNDQASRLLRRPREELLGQNVWEQFPEVRGTAFERLSHQATRGTRHGVLRGVLHASRDLAECPFLPICGGPGRLFPRHHRPQGCGSEAHSRRSKTLRRASSVCDWRWIAVGFGTYQN